MCVVFVRSVRPSCLSVCPPACLAVCLSVCASVCSVWLFRLAVLSRCPMLCVVCRFCLFEIVLPSVRLFMCLCVCKHICVCVGDLKLHTQSMEGWQTLMKLEASCWNARFTMRLQLPHFLFTPSCSCVVLS